MILGLGVVCLSGILTLLLSYLKLDKQIDKWLFKELSPIKIPPVPLDIILEREISPEYETVQQVISGVLRSFTGEPLNSNIRTRMANQIRISLERLHIPVPTTRFRIIVPNMILSSAVPASDELPSLETTHFETIEIQF